MALQDDVLNYEHARTRLLPSREEKAYAILAHTIGLPIQAAEYARETKHENLGMLLASITFSLPYASCLLAESPAGFFGYFVSTLAVLSTGVGCVEKWNKLKSDRQSIIRTNLESNLRLYFLEN